MKKFLILLLILICTVFLMKKSNAGNYPDLILYNGKIIMVNENFDIVEAVAIQGDRFRAVGTNEEIEQLAGSSTKKINLNGKAVIPGLIDAHVHPEGASLSELDEEIPYVRTVDELLSWVRKQVEEKKPGEWIQHPKLFFTRLKEMRRATLKELDKAAPNNPVFVVNSGYGGMINSYAMRISGITKDTDHTGILKDPVTGNPTGFIRSSAYGLLKGKPSTGRDKKLSYKKRLDALVNMIKRYNSVGITGFWSGGGGPENLKMYMDLWKSGRLTARVFQNIRTRNIGIDIRAPIKEIREKLLNLGYYTGFGNEWIRVGALKVGIDGGILGGTAYLRKSWGDRATEVFKWTTTHEISFTDPGYRGQLRTTTEELIPIATVANEIGWKMTGHSTGGGGVDIMLAAYEEVNKIKPIKSRRFSIIHGNFFTPEAIKKMKRLGVCADIQPVWFHDDADAMKYILGDKTIKTFHPYKSLFDADVNANGGSDHMVKFDSYTSTNFYNPFKAMWSIITRKTQWGTVIVPEEAISREQALKLFTINNAYGSFEENIKGSIEPEKLADLVVISDDILDCPVDKIKDIKAEMTIVGGKIVYRSKSSE